MKIKTLMLLRKCKSILSVILPDSIIDKIEQTLRTIYRKRKSAKEGDSHQIRDKISSQVQDKVSLKNQTAIPLQPFVCENGLLIDYGYDFVKKLSDEKSSRICDLVICCAFSGRHQILERVINESFSSNEADNIRWMLVGSTPEDNNFIRALAAKTGKVAGCIVENNPLGRKWQACVKLARDYYSAELYGITGSDDILSRQLIDYIIRRHRQNKNNAINVDFMPSMYATLEWLVFNTNEKGNFSFQIIKCNYEAKTAFQPLGAGRFYTRKFIESIKADIFENSWEKCLDDKGYFQVVNNQNTLEYYKIEDGPLISVKGSWSQLNPIEAFLETDTLSLSEYSFKGSTLLKDSLSDGTYKSLFKPAVLSPQLNFSIINTGVS